MKKELNVFCAMAFCAVSWLYAFPALHDSIQVDVTKTLLHLISEEDTDGDRKITADDTLVPGTPRGDHRFSIQTADGRTVEIEGVYHLSTLLQELALRKEAGKSSAYINLETIYETPVRRISRKIREEYWDGLTRRIDGEHLKAILKDSKVDSDSAKYLYVACRDTFAYSYFTKVSQADPSLNLRVVDLPEPVTPQFVKDLNGKHGLLPLALELDSAGHIHGKPFVVPGGRFNEMYGWDSYFEALGLIADGKVELAKAMVDNFIYEITTYRKILNANRTYYLTRSQPPFLTSMALAVYESLPKTSDVNIWLKTVLKTAIQEYETVWMDQNHLTETGLSRYYGTGIGIPPETEPGHFKRILSEYARKYQLSIEAFSDAYQQGEIHESELDQFFVHDRAVRESGHDTTFRWMIDGKDQCADFITVDLNALLYKYEIDIAYILQFVFLDTLTGQSSALWAARAQRRGALIRQCFWNPDHHLFFDYFIPGLKQSGYISTTTLYPLWACDPKRTDTLILSQQEANLCIAQALDYLEALGGLLSGARESLESLGVEPGERQWDYPYGWAPHQMIVWQALKNYGHDAIADRLIYKWLYMIAKNASQYNGTIPEKFDVIDRTHKVFAEYGNVGTRFSYMTREGFGWMNASFQVGLKLLSPEWRPSLEKLIPPEEIDFTDE